ncbi:MAG: outer membrane lipoprotein-sorting protein [Pseudomonadales bacterium]|nr:outer membrane lipoprotein-sorting protein [Pseudomonadales bacterium]
MLKSRLSIAICFLANFIFTAAVASADAARSFSGEQIVRKCLENGKHHNDMVQEVTMRLIDEEGDVQERSMRMKALLTEEKEKFSLITFTAPRREKGIALLTVAKADSKSGDQFLYLPSTRRVKRILGASRSASFRGSEFTFEDLSDQSLENYRFEYVGKAKCGQWQCYLVDRFPKQDGSNYQRTRLWIDQEHFRLVKADFHDHDGAFLKTLAAHSFKLEKNNFWYPRKLVMQNHLNGKRTEMLVNDVAFNPGLKVADFSERALRRGR